MYEVIVPNLKLQIALEEMQTQTPFVPNLVQNVKPPSCCILGNQCCSIPPPPSNPCCTSPIADALELRALEIETYNKYAPKFNCCGSRKRW